MINNICYICKIKIKDTQTFYDTGYINCPKCGEYKFELSIDFKLYKKEDFLKVLEAKRKLGEKTPKIILNDIK